MIVHELKASTGIGGGDMTTGDLENVDENVVVNLANARVPRYTTSILFLKLIAYTLGWNRIRWLRA